MMGYLKEKEVWRYL